MKKIWTNGVAVLLVFMMTAANTVAKQAPTSQLNKVYYHEFNSRRQDNPSYYMEYGKVVFYFDKDFEMPPLKRLNSNKNQEVIVFHFPKTMVKTPECKEMISELNKKKFPLFAFKIETNDSKGTTFSITFDPKKIEVDVRSFDSIGLQKGLAFNLINKTLLEDLAHKVNPVLRTACLEKTPHIVIDCGHGGEDTGTIGFFGIKEKDVSLQIGLLVAQFLNEQGVTTHLTRESDVMMALDARTLYANSVNAADLFVSIHANNSSNITASGVETFCLKPALLAQKFSTYDQKKKSIIDAAHAHRYEQSIKLAQAIHGKVIALAQGLNNNLVDRSVKSSVTQVLMGSQMPSALIEVGFLSNQHEAELLANPAYQECLAHGIGKGILSYLAQQA